MYIWNIMSKRELKKYLSSLSKKQLETQMLDIYVRFKPVKEYYNFVFNPNEEKLISECKFKINKEYFPTNTRKPKKRRSTAHKFIKKFKLLGVNPLIIADIMIFNIEVAQKFSVNNNMPDSFFTSMIKSFREAVEYIQESGLRSDFRERLEKIVDNSVEQDWINYQAFENTLL